MWQQRHCSLHGCHVLRPCIQRYTTSFCRLQQLDPVISQYRDRRFEGNQEQFEQALRMSTTIYVGNLSFFTTEEQIYEVCCWSASPATWKCRHC